MFHFLVFYENYTGIDVRKNEFEVLQNKEQIKEKKAFAGIVLTFAGNVRLLFISQIKVIFWIPENRLSYDQQSPCFHH